MIRTLKFALRNDLAESKAISYHATQQNAAYNLAVYVVNREPELPKRSSRSHPYAMNEQVARWRKSNRHQAQAPYYIHQEGAERAWEAKQWLQAVRAERLTHRQGRSRTVQATGHTPPPLHAETPRWATEIKPSPVKAKTSSETVLTSLTRHSVRLLSVKGGRLNTAPSRRRW